MFTTRAFVANTAPELLEVFGKETIIGPLELQLCGASPSDIGLLIDLKLIPFLASKTAIYGLPISGEALQSIATLTTKLSDCGEYQLPVSNSNTTFNTLEIAGINNAIHSTLEVYTGWKQAEAAGVELATRNIFRVVDGVVICGHLQADTIENVQNDDESNIVTHLVSVSFKAEPARYDYLANEIKLDEEYELYETQLTTYDSEVSPLDKGWANNTFDSGMTTIKNSGKVNIAIIKPTEIGGFLFKLNSGVASATTNVETGEIKVTYSDIYADGGKFYAQYGAVGKDAEGNVPKTPEGIEVGFVLATNNRHKVTVGFSPQCYIVEQAQIVYGLDGAEIETESFDTQITFFNPGKEGEVIFGSVMITEVPHAANFTTMDEFRALGELYTENVIHIAALQRPWDSVDEEYSKAREVHLNGIRDFIMTNRLAYIKHGTIPESATDEEARALEGHCNMLLKQMEQMGADKEKVIGALEEAQAQEAAMREENERLEQKFVEMAEATAATNAETNAQ